MVSAAEKGDIRRLVTPTMAERNDVMAIEPAVFAAALASFINESAALARTESDLMFDPSFEWAAFVPRVKILAIGVTL